MKIAGVYIIECICNGRIYVGSSVNVQARFKWHRQALRRGRHHSMLLQRAWNMYGEEGFTFRVVEEVGDLLWLRPREQAWLKREGATDPSKGFNNSDNAWDGYCHVPASAAKHRRAVTSSMRTPEMRSMLSQLQLQRFEDQDVRAAFQAAHNTDEAKQNHTAAAYARWADEETRRAYKAAATNPTLLAKRSEQSKAMWADPDHREKIRRAAERRREEKARALTPEALEAQRQKRREAKSEEQRRRRARQKAALAQAS